MSNMEIDRVLAQIRSVSQGGGVGGARRSFAAAAGGGPVQSTTASPSC